MSDPLKFFINQLKTDAHFKTGGILEEYAKFMKDSISSVLMNVETSFSEIMTPVENLEKHLENYQGFINQHRSELYKMHLSKNPMERALAEDRYNFMHEFAEEINEKSESHIRHILWLLTLYRKYVTRDRRVAKQYCRRLTNNNRQLSNVINNITKLYRDTVFAILIQIEVEIIDRFRIRDEWLHKRYQPLSTVLCHGIEPSSMRLNLW